MTRRSDPKVFEPKTNRDWFLYHLFNDPKFVEIREEFKIKLSRFDPGISQLLEHGVDERSNELLDTYAKRIGELFDITEEIAKKGLLHNKHLGTWSRSRTPSAEMEGNSILIRIGSETRLDDIKDIWSWQVAPLQDKLSSTRSKRLVPSERPSLAYVVHKQILSGRNMADIHRDYQHLKLDGYDGVYGEEEYSEFVRHYKNTVDGIKKVS